jgi:hypothetical protein
VSNETITLAILLSLSLVTIVLIIDDIRLRVRRLALLKLVVELNVDKMILQDELIAKNATPSETEGFIKFLSESREWAFDYIENVQKSINILSEAKASGDDEKINKAYDELIAYLPNDKE